jgi:hypothetical protein
MKDTEAYQHGYQVGRCSVGSPLPSDDAKGHCVETFGPQIRYFRERFRDHEWETWTGDFDTYGRMNAAVSVFVWQQLPGAPPESESDFLVWKPRLPESDFLDARALAAAWWTTLLATDVAAGKLRQLSAAFAAQLLDHNFVKGFIDGAVDAFKRWPGGG